jgi:hypothetical protein
MPQRRTRTDRLLRWSLLALFVVVIPCNANADSISPADYHQNVQRAVTALDTLRTSDETETASAYEKRLDQTIAGVNEVLPERQSVDTKGGVCNVDNAWLHAALKDLKNAPAEQREGRLAQIIDRLHAVEERVDAGRATPENDKAQTKAKLDSILKRPEYATEVRGPNALSRLLMDFIRWLQQFLPKGPRIQPGSSPWMTLIAQILVVLVAGIVVFYVAKILLARFKPKRQRRAPKKREARIVLGERLAPDDTAIDLLAEGEALARSGDVRGAIRKAYIALLVELGDRKLITLGQHKTNRDYLNAVRTLPPLHQTMGGLTDTFERHWYGFAEANENDWHDFRSGYHSALQN